MPEVDENLRAWTQWDWSQQGDEWSAFWGGTPAMWFGALLPRIHAFVPTGTILEIAPGTSLDAVPTRLAERLVVVDLTESCIEHCRKRFEESADIVYHVDDGRSLDMVETESVDFTFSFDSLVHAESDVIRAYLERLAPETVRMVSASSTAPTSAVLGRLSRSRAALQVALSDRSPPWPADHRPPRRGGPKA